MQIPSDNPLLLQAAAFKVLASAFGYPKKEFADIAVSGVWEELGRSLAQGVQLSEATLGRLFSPSCNAMVKEFWSMPLADVQAAYMQTFDLGKPQPPCPPYTGLYLSGAESYPGPRTEFISSLQYTYLKWGLEPSAELADHVSVELEFMHFLCIVGNSAADAADRMTLEAVSADFEWLREHLADCGPKIARDLTEKAVRPFWSVAADLVANLVAEISFDQLAAELW